MIDDSYDSHEKRTTRSWHLVHAHTHAHRDPLSQNDFRSAGRIR